MTLEATLRGLESPGNAGIRAQNAKSGPLGSGAGDNQFGVSRGDVRILAKKITTDGWQLTAGRVAKSPEGLDLAALLDRIEKEMAAGTRRCEDGSGA
ncbi:MAG TPA: hypothetical protein VNJ03_10070 [Vicinamibacterales bacterium]|nr:hypothetical protein [Vicinamibacterales bacterium]